jgi:hypothetical protein
LILSEVVCINLILVETNHFKRSNPTDTLEALLSECPHVVTTSYGIDQSNQNLMDAEAILCVPPVVASISTTAEIGPPLLDGEGFRLAFLYPLSFLVAKIYRSNRVDSFLRDTEGTWDVPLVVEVTEETNSWKEGCHNFAVPSFIIWISISLLYSSCLRFPRFFS